MSARKEIQALIRQPLWRGFSLVLLFLVYFFSGKLGLSLAFVNSSATAVWPPTGIAIAIFLLFGYRIWPLIFAGAFLVNVTTSGVLTSSIGIAIGNTLEGLCAAYLVTRYAHGLDALKRSKDVVNFAFFAGIVSTAISATIGVTTLVLFSLASYEDYWHTWFTWWLGDMGGALIVAPLLLIWMTARSEHYSRKQRMELAAMYLSMCLVALTIFGRLISAFPIDYPIGFISVLPLLWAGFRFRSREAITAGAVLSAIATWGTIHGIGPFVRTTPNESLLLVQVFICVMMTLAATVAAVVTERRDSEERFRALIEHSSDAITLVDREATIKYASASTKNVTGFMPEELIGRNGFDFVHKDDQNVTKTLLQSLVATENKLVTAEIRLRRKGNPAWLWTEVTATNLLHEPSVRAIVINYHDISSRKKDERIFMAYHMRLEREKVKTEAVIGSIGDSIIAIDRVGKIILVNKAFERYFGWNADEVIGKQTEAVVPIETLDNGDEPLSREQRPLVMAVATGKKVVSNYSITRRDGTKFPANVTATPIILENQIIGAVKVIHDISKEREIDRAKSEFISLASHQLRTPPTIIKWYVDSLLRDSGSKFTAKQREYLSIVFQSNERMINLIGALLNVSRLELGTFSVETKETDISKLAQNVVANLRLKINEKKIKIIESYAPDIPMMSLDQNIMAIVLENVLSNAVKYTPEGGTITLTILQLKAGTETNKTDQDSLLIRVTDTGIGIPESQKDKIFTKLFRADNVREVDPDGTGLGLYIVKKMLDQLGGAITFESKEKQGTRFSIVLPMSGMVERKGSTSLLSNLVLTQTSQRAKNKGASKNHKNHAK